MPQRMQKLPVIGKCTERVDTAIEFLGFLNLVITKLILIWYLARAYSSNEFLATLLLQIRDNGDGRPKF